MAPSTFELRTGDKPTDAFEGRVLVDIVRVGLCGTAYHIFGGKIIVPMA